MSKRLKIESNDSSTPLDRYDRNKKVLTPPLAGLANTVLTSWTNNRMPDMLWAVLIRNYHPGNTGYAIFRNALNWLRTNKDTSDVLGVTHTDISKYDEHLMKGFIKRVVNLAGTDSLMPLLLLDDLPAYSCWKEALGDADLNYEGLYNQLATAISDVMFHQTQEATDVRWVKLMGTILSGKMHLPARMLDEYLEYPHKYNQRLVRPSIRSSEMGTEMIGDGDTTIKNEWPDKFWHSLQKNTICIPETDLNKESVLKQYVDESEDKKHFNDILPKVRKSLIFHCLDTSATTGVDARHETAFGLALYALDVFIENVILKVGGTSSGRVNARIIFETYVTLKYLLSKENLGEKMWDSYREYGIGQISLVERKYKECGYDSAMVDAQIMDDIVNEDKWQEYVPINLGHWDASDLRTISIAIGEKDMYDQYYPYTSGYIHASWGAIRETSFQKCINPLHRFHRIPRFGLPVLSGVNEDCRQMMNKIFMLIDELYPGFNQFINERPIVKKENRKSKNNRTSSPEVEIGENKNNRT